MVCVTAMWGGDTMAVCFVPSAGLGFPSRQVFCILSKEYSNELFRFRFMPGRYQSFQEHCRGIGGMPNLAINLLEDSEIGEAVKCVRWGHVISYGDFAPRH